MLNKCAILALENLHGKGALSSIRNALDGVSNISSDWLNSYKASELDCFVADFIDTAERHKIDFGFYDGLPVTADDCIQYAASEFYHALEYTLREKCCDSMATADYILKGNSYFDSFGDYFIFRNEYGQCWIIRAQNECDALEWLLCEFEKSFIIDESDYTQDELESFVLNDNDNYCNIDYLTLFCVIKGQ